MTYYLIYREKELRLIPVEAELEELFIQANEHRILASGETMLEALRTFDALPPHFLRRPQRGLSLLNKKKTIQYLVFGWP